MVEGAPLLRVRQRVSAAVVVNGDVALFDINVWGAILSHCAQLHKVAVWAEILVEIAAKTKAKDAGLLIMRMPGTVTYTYFLQSTIDTLHESCIGNTASSKSSQSNSLDTHVSRARYNEHKSVHALGRFKSAHTLQFTP